MTAKTLTVRWAIDMETSDFDPEEGDVIVAAAREALTMLQDQSSIATVFTVEDDLGSTYVVDLSDTDPQPRPITPF